MHTLYHNMHLYVSASAVSGRKLCFKCYHVVCGTFHHVKEKEELHFQFLFCAIFTRNLKELLQNK